MLINQYLLNVTEIVEAIGNPRIRHLVRCEHNCDDNELHKHPDWLLNKWVSSGMSKEFNKEVGRWT